MVTILIKNGRVIDPSQNIDGKFDVLLEGDKVVQLTKPGEISAAEQVIDAQDKIVTPGLIDMHVHLRDPGFEYKEDIKTGCKAAAAGGFTTICCMPNTDPVNDCASVTEYIRTKAKEVGLITVYPIGAISKGSNGKQLADIGDMAKAGVVALSDDGFPCATAGLLRRGMEYAKTFNLPIISHSEDTSLSLNGVMHEGTVSTQLGLAGIPSASEEVGVARDILVAELTKTPLHIAHVSSRGSVEIIRQAKLRGVLVTAEVTPHHVTLTDEVTRGYDPNAKMNPPVRNEEDRSALIAALADGTIDVFATDHAPHSVMDKELGFDLAPFGIVGLETALPLGIKLVQENKLSLKRLIESMTTAPAKILNMSTKGSLKPGMDADVTIFDPEAAFTVAADSFRSKSQNTPFDGCKFSGRVINTIALGKVVFSQ